MAKDSLKEIEWGLCAGGDNARICIYALGNLEPECFLALVRRKQDSDIPFEAREALDVLDVEHVRFRPMSPSEARAWGCDSGVIEATEGDRGYAVTRVIL